MRETIRARIHRISAGDGAKPIVVAARAGASSRPRRIRIAPATERLAEADAGLLTVTAPESAVEHTLS